MRGQSAISGVNLFPTLKFGLIHQRSISEEWPGGTVHPGSGRPGVPDTVPISRIALFNSVGFERLSSCEFSFLFASTFSCINCINIHQYRKAIWTRVMDSHGHTVRVRVFSRRSNFKPTESGREPALDNDQLGARLASARLLPARRPNS